MNAACHDLLACAAFPGDKHGFISERETPGLFQQRPETRAVSQKIIEGKVRPGTFRRIILSGKFFLLPDFHHGAEGAYSSDDDSVINDRPVITNNINMI